MRKKNTALIITISAISAPRSCADRSNDKEEWRIEKVADGEISPHVGQGNGTAG